MCPYEKSLETYLIHLVVNWNPFGELVANGYTGDIVLVDLL